MHYKQNNKESIRYVQGLRPFGNTLPRGVKGLLKKNGYNYSEIISKWNMFVGKDISNFSFPKSIKPKRDGSGYILFLAIKRGNEINIEYSKKEIINKINSYFGYKLIDEIKLQTINSENKKIKKNKTKYLLKNFKENIDKIQNKNIRDSLHKLSKAMENG